MEPITNKLLAGDRFRLGDFVFMMDWYMVYPAGVNIHSFAKVLHTHGRTLYVPTREAFSPNGRPAHYMVFESACRLKPQNKISRIPFLGVGMHFLSGGCYLVFQFLAGKIVNYVCGLKKKIDEPTYDVGFGDEAKNYRQKFIDAISDDIQAPKAVAVLWEIVKSNIPAEEKLKLILEIDEVLGLNLKNAKFFAVEIPEEITKLAQEREEVRLAKDFKKSDELRKIINEKGYVIKDTDEGYKISKR